MRVMLTGASGFVGSAVVAALARRGCELLLISKEPQTDAPVSSIVVTEDLADPEGFLPQVAGFAPEALVHLAWEGIPDFSLELCLRNLATSAGVIRGVMREAPCCRRVVVSGSCFEYGISHGPCREDAEPVLTSHFTWAKDALRRFADFESGAVAAALLWLRIFYVYGPGQRPGSLVPTLVTAFTEGESPSISAPYNANDFVYVDDVGEAFALAAIGQAPGGVYNVGSGRSTRIAEVCRTVERRVCGTEAETERIIASASSGVPPADFWADATQSSAVLGWRATTSFEDGIDRYVSWLEAL